MPHHAQAESSEGGSVNNSNSNFINSSNTDSSTPQRASSDFGRVLDLIKQPAALRSVDKRIIEKGQQILTPRDKLLEDIKGGAALLSPVPKQVARASRECLKGCFSL